MMLHKNDGFIPGTIIGFILGITITTVILAILHAARFADALERQERAFRQQAVDVGAAMWVVDQNTGKVEFVFLSAATPIGGPASRNWTETDVTRKP